MAPRKISPTKATAALPKASDLPENVFSLPGLKRKTAQVTETGNSDDDEDPFTTPKPSPKKARHATPGSPEFDELPSVSFNAPSTPHLSAVSQRLTFGSDDTPFDLTTPPPSPVPASVQKRIRKPSEKAEYMNSTFLTRVYPDGTELKYTPARLRSRANLSPTKPSPSQAPTLPVVPEVAETPNPEEHETNTHLTMKVRRFVI
ncbi:hypothetical protein BD779DRAFT_1469091 [Infundibulicybe gibba]|nr:hypothetical protein BD779DRAFT_1469091 [Infundibulicybe gibba]